MLTNMSKIVFLTLDSFPLKRGSAPVGSDRKDSQELTGHDKACTRRVSVVALRGGERHSEDSR